MNRFLRNSLFLLFVCSSMYFAVNASSSSSSVKGVTEATPQDNVRPYEVALAEFRDFLKKQEAILEGPSYLFPPAAGKNSSVGSVSDTAGPRQKPGKSEFVIPVHDQSEKTKEREEEGGEKTDPKLIGHWHIMKILSANPIMQPTSPSTSSSSSPSSSSQDRELVVIIDFVPEPDEKRGSEFFKEIIQAFDKIISVSVGRIMVSDVLNIAKRGNKLIIIPQDIAIKLNLAYTKEDLSSQDAQAASIPVVPKMGRNFEIMSSINSLDSPKFNNISVVKQYLHEEKAGVESFEKLIKSLLFDTQFRPNDAPKDGPKYDTIVIDPQISHSSSFCEDILDKEHLEIIYEKEYKFPLYRTLFHEMNHYRQLRTFSDACVDFIASFHNRQLTEQNLNSLGIYYFVREKTGKLANMEKPLEELQEIGFTRLKNKNEIRDRINEMTFAIQLGEKIRYPYKAASDAHQKLHINSFINIISASFESMDRAYNYIIQKINKIRD